MEIKGKENGKEMDDLMVMVGMERKKRRRK